MIETLVESLSAATAARPDKPAFSFEGRQTSFADFERHTNQVANGLRAEGLQAGERIAYIGKNSDLYFEALYGAIKAGLVMVPVNWRLAGPEIAAIVADAQARLILVGPEFVDTVRAELAGMNLVTRVLSMQGETAQWPDFATWRDGFSAALLPHTPGADDVAVQLYTSGTTGQPKGVMLSHRNFTASIDGNLTADLKWAKWVEGDAAVLAMPVSHISGTGWGLIAVHHAATCHVQRQFDIELTLDMIERDRISKIFLVPAALQFLVRHPRAAGMDFSRILDMGYGASPMPLPLLRECMQVLRCGFVQFYGMTETTGTIVALPPEDHVAEGSPRMRAAGKPLPWVELRIVDAVGRDLKHGEVGEIVVRSPTNMVGYWNKPAETAHTLRNGWLHTGDAGYMDEDGYIYIHDRVKDMIISGGENVYPAEVENTLAGHPAIAEVAVIGVPHGTWGESVKAVVVLRPGATLTESELIAWSRARIGGFKLPRSVDFVDALPRNATGKVLKRALREPYWAEKGRQVN